MMQHDVRKLFYLHYMTYYKQNISIQTLLGDAQPFALQSSNVNENFLKNHLKKIPKSMGQTAVAPVAPAMEPRRNLK